MKKTLAVLTIVILATTGCTTTDTLSRMADATSHIRLYNGRNVGETTIRIDKVEGDLILNGGEALQEIKGTGGFAADTNVTP